MITALIETTNEKNMNAAMKAKIDQHLETDREVVRLSREVRATGGDSKVCDAYDVAEQAERDSYDANIQPGLTKEGWAYYDKQRAEIYRGI